MLNAKTVLDELLLEDRWRSFLEYKRSRGYLFERDEKELIALIEKKGYLPIVRKVRNGESLDKPTLKILNKAGTSKKRVVYSFETETAWTLKLLGYLLHRYDYHFAPNCFSFRKDFGVRSAIKNLIKDIKNKELYCYKLDVSNYFNSISVSELLPMLQKLFENDLKLFEFFRMLLTLVEGGGVMAGTPTSPFLSNVYLTELDRYFYDNGADYARYSDDIILFAKTKEDIDAHKLYIKNHLTKLGLEINKKKEEMLEPNKPWSFLGIKYINGEVDLSDITFDKIKAKIKRKARALRRWCETKNIESEKAVKTMIKVFNKKFYEDAGKNELTWCRWFFPLITTDKSLKHVDEYLQNNLRFIMTGKHNKLNYKHADYGFLKKLGYRSLVNAYHKEHKVHSTTCAV